MDRQFRRFDRGQGMVEFAIVFPVLLLLLFGIFEFGRLMFAYSAAISASREAARYGAAILDTGGGIPQYEDCAGIRASALRIGQFAGISEANISIQYSDDSGIYDTSCPPNQEVEGEDRISVTINALYTPVTPLGDLGTVAIRTSSSRTILKSVRLGVDGTGAGSVSGALSDVNFKTTSQTAVESQGTISVVLELNQVATNVVTIPFSVTGTAFSGAGNDYLMTASPVTINPGQKTATIYITLNNDGLAEPNETIVIGIDSPVNATRGPQYIHTITVVDPPEISFKEVASTHGEGDPMTAFMVELSKGSTQDVSVSFNYGGSAVWGGGADYVTSPATLTIPSGSLTGMITFQVNDDLKDEYDEVALISMVSPVNASLGSKSTHSATITDNDLPPQVYFPAANQIVSEEIGVFTTLLTLSEASGKDIVIPYTVSGTTIPADYLIHDPSPLTLPAGNDTLEISMDILEGDGWEEDETLIITLGTPQNAVLGSPSSQTIVITESSTMPTVSFTSSGRTVTEGNLPFAVDVQLSNAWSVPVVMHFSVAGSALPGSSNDYSISGSPLTIPVGYTQGSIQVAIHDDYIDESLEDIQINMGLLEDGLPGAITSHQIQIQDDDLPPEVSFSISQATASEDGGSVSVGVDLNTTSVNDVSIPLSFSGSASMGSDYTVSTATVFIPAGSSSANIQVTPIDDFNFESDEEAVISLGSPTNAVVGSPATFTLKIEDNELSPCDVGVHMLTVGTDSLSLSIVNEGGDLTFTGGSATWQKSSGIQPQLLSVAFGGTNVYTGSVKPTSLTYSASVGFSSLDTQALVHQFDSALGTGTHAITANFSSAVDGSTCSVTETFNIH